MQFSQQLQYAKELYGDCWGGLRRHVPFGEHSAYAEQQVQRSEAVLRRIEQASAQRPAALSRLQSALRAIKQFLDQPVDLRPLHFAKAELDSAEAELDMIAPQLTTPVLASQAGAGVVAHGGPVAAAAGYTTGQQQQQQLSAGGPEPDAPGLCGELVRHQLSKVTAVQLCPSRYMGSPDLVVALMVMTGTPPFQVPKLEVLFGCKANSKVAKDRLSAQVTCCACSTCDGDTYVWTGHKDGTVQVHLMKPDTAEGIKSSIAVLPLLRTSAAVRALAIDTQGRCWAGDDAGSIHVIERQGTRLDRVSTKESAAQGQRELPVQAMLCRDQYVFSAGGFVSHKPSHSISLWDVHTRERLGRFDCSKYGAVCSFAAWSLAEPHRPSADWLLLSGHDGGQVVLRRVHGSGINSSLVALRPASLGTFTKDSTVLGLFAYPEWSMLVVAHSSKGYDISPRHHGTMTVYQLPAAAALLQGGSTSVTRRPVVVDAHEKEMVGATSLGNTMITCSQRTIRAWSPQHLAQEAAKDGVHFVKAALQPSPSSTPLTYVGSSSSSSMSSSLQGAGSSVPSPFASANPDSVANVQLPQPSWQPPPQQQVQPAADSGGKPLQEGRSEAEQFEKLRQRLCKQAEKKSEKPRMGGSGKGDAGSSSTAALSSSPGDAIAAAAGRTPGANIVMEARQPTGPVATEGAASWSTFQDPVKPGQVDKKKQSPSAQDILQLRQPVKVEPVQPATDPGAEPPDAPAAELAAELSSHCGYQWIRVQSPPFMFGPNRAMQARCNVSNRLRTVLQVARKQLQQLDQSQAAFAQQELLLATDLHHPHLLQVQEVFVGPVHLNVGLEECSAGRLVEFPAKHREQAAAWGGDVSPADAVPALSADFARWFFQQVVLAVDYYHAVLASSSADKQLPSFSSLSIRDTLLKVAPSLPQPVVKVPTALLARGLSAAYGPPAATATDRCWIPPEGQVAAKQVHKRTGILSALSAADVWACGVLLVVLLGGSLTTAAHNIDSTAPVFELPNGASADGKGSVAELLHGMLERDAGARLKLSGVMKHPWFDTSLPKTAHDMTQRFLGKGRSCKQPHEEIQAVLEAALGSKRPVAPKQQQQQQPQSLGPAAVAKEEQQQQSLAPAVRPELAYCVQLQVNALQQAYAALVTGCQALELSSSALAVLQLLVAQQVAAGCASSVKWLVNAFQDLTQYNTLMQQHLLMGQRRVLGLNAMLLLQQRCSKALYNLSKLQELLQSSGASAGSAAAAGSAGAQGMPTQRKLLGQGHRTLGSLWRCCQAAHAAVAAVRWWRSGTPKAVSKLSPLPRPGVQLIPAAVGVAAVAQFKAGQEARVCAELAYKGARQLQQQQQQQQRRLQVVKCVDDLTDLLIEAESASARTASSSSSSDALSGCISYKGLLELPQAGAFAGSQQDQQQAVQFEQVQVVGLAPLVTPDYSKGPPHQRSQLREQRSGPDAAAREQLQQQAAGAYKGYFWEQAGDHVGLAYACEAHSTDALNSLKQVLLELQDKGHFSSIGSSKPLLVPVYGMCLRPPLLVMPRAAGGTLEGWIHSKAAEVSVPSSSTAGGAADGWVRAWQSQLPSLAVLHLLSDVAAGLLALHHHQPPCVHGSVHARSVVLPPDFGTSAQDQTAQVSLAGLLKKLAPVSSCHPFLAAPEAALATGPATPASDVYGFGILMFQLATGWLPQQYTAGTDEQVSAVLWCRQMMAKYGSTSPIAAAEDRRRSQLEQQQQGSRVPHSAGQLLESGDDGRYYSPYGCHLVTGAAQQQLPQDYYELMARCLHTVPPARPNMVQVLAQLEHLSRTRMGCS